ncbi:hypothetical protein [Streptomyces sp. KHY 26]|uniref:hypothetical protein n=1 Tax=Streptomyces sp. KHY 26 TaxID=3097359 RepID=UPI00376F16BD
MSGVPAGRIPAPYAAPARRAIQVTLVAAAGFCFFRYGLDRPIAATCALFAEVHLLDVLVGSATGAVFGLPAWPRGAHDELRFAAAELLRRAAGIVVATSASAAREGPAAVPSGMTRAPFAAACRDPRGVRVRPVPERARAVRGRGRGPAPLGVGWQAALMAGHHTLWGSERLPEPPYTGRGPAAATVAGLGDRVAGRMLPVSATLDRGGDTPSGPVPRLARSLPGADAEPSGCTTAALRHRVLAGLPHGRSVQDRAGRRRGGGDGPEGEGGGARGGTDGAEAGGGGTERGSDRAGSG